MQLTLTGHHLDVTEALKSYVEEKFQRLERHFDHVMDAHVILSVEKTRHKAESTIHLSGNNIFADCEQDDMYAAIDCLIDKLDRQVVRHKEKMKDHHRSEGSHRNNIAMG